MERFGLVGLPNAGQVVPVQRPHGRRRAVAAHPFSTTETNVGVAKVPDHAARRAWPRCARVEEGGPRHGRARRHRRARQKGSSQGEGLGNRFLGRHPRGRRHLLRAARLRGRRTCPGDATRSTTSRRWSSSWCWPTPPASSRSSTSAARRPAVRQVAGRRGRRARAAPSARLQGATPLYRAGLDAEDRGAAAAVLPADDQAGPRRGQPRRGRPRRRRRRRGSRSPASSDGVRRGARRCASSSRRRPAASTPPSGPSCSKASAWARARCPASSAPPTTCSGCARSSPRATRRAGPGRSGPAPRPRSAPASSTPTCSAASSAPRSSAGTSCSSIGSWNKAKELGKLRVEGKDYEVVDGDVLEIRFNV